MKYIHPHPHNSQTFTTPVDAYHEPTEAMEHREQAKDYVAYCVDDAMSTHNQPITDRTRLVGWQCGFEPLFVAVNSYLPDCTVGDDEAAELAKDMLEEIGWFNTAEGVTEPDFIY
jgi:hypothetical protein